LHHFVFRSHAFGLEGPSARGMKLWETARPLLAHQRSGDTPHWGQLGGA